MGMILHRLHFFHGVFPGVEDRVSHWVSLDTQVAHLFQDDLRSLDAQLSTTTLRAVAIQPWGTWMALRAWGDQVAAHGPEQKPLDEGLVSPSCPSVGFRLSVYGPTLADHKEWGLHVAAASLGRAYRWLNERRKALYGESRLDLMECLDEPETEGKGLTAVVSLVKRALSKEETAFDWGRWTQGLSAVPAEQALERMTQVAKAGPTLSQARHRS